MKERFCQCDFTMKPNVYLSAAGWYIGYFCNNCGPYDRISANYYRTDKEAREAMTTGKFLVKEFP